MKFKVWFFSPLLEEAVKGWGETCFYTFASSEEQAYKNFRVEFPDAGNLVRKIEFVPDSIFHDNVKLRQDEKKNNFTLDPTNPQFEEFFAFDGVVTHSDQSVSYKSDQVMFVWNGKFDW